MRHWIRSQLTYANVVATLALFLVLGGGAAWAANTIGSADIIDNEVYSADVRDDTLTGGGLGRQDLNAGSVRSSEVTNNTLATPDFAKSIPAAHVTNSANQTVPSFQYWTLAFDTERYDTANTHDNATNNSRLTAPVTGIYAVTAQVVWAPASGNRELLLRKNGTTEIARDSRQPTGVDFAQSVTTQVRLQAGDYVEAWVYQSSTQDPLPIYASAERSPEFSMTWLAPGP